MNVFSSTVIWTLWKTRNDMCFQGACWKSLENLLGRCARLLRNWILLSKPGEVTKLEAWAKEMVIRSASPPRLPWIQERDSRSSGSKGVGEVDDINNVMHVLSFVLPNLTPKWVCDTAAQLCTMPVRLTRNLNMLLVSDE
jgi:hypothetical protein